jgi:prolipoprotein diacylglyceryl transferase
MTDWELYFSEGGKGFLSALRIWEGGLGIWGAIALGGVGAWIGAKRQGVAFAPFADSIAPGVAFAQAIGRFGNWFNQELFGRPTTLPWGLEIDTANRPTNFTQFETFHPTFLYEAIACTLIGLFLLRADKRYVMGHGRVFALYVAMYCAARGLIETIRIDDARLILGIRLNVFTALLIGAGALLYLVRSSEKNPGREVLSGGKLVLQDRNSEISQESIAEAAVLQPDNAEAAEAAVPTQPLAPQATPQTPPQPNQPGRRRKT